MNPNPTLAFMAFEFESELQVTELEAKRLRQDASSPATNQSLTRQFLNTLGVQLVHAGERLQGTSRTAPSGPILDTVIQG